MILTSTGFFVCLGVFLKVCLLVQSSFYPFDSQGTEQLPAQLSCSLFILPLFPFIRIICANVPHQSVFPTLQQSTDLRETRQKSLCSGRLVKILRARCSHPQMEWNLSFPSQLAAIEASFIQLKPKLVKSLSSQHLSAGRRVCGQGGAARTCHPCNPQSHLKPQPLMQNQHCRE